MSDPTNTAQQTLIRQVLALMRTSAQAAGRTAARHPGETAWRSLYQGMGHPIQRFLERSNVPTPDAEEIMSDAIFADCNAHRCGANL